MGSITRKINTFGISFLEDKLFNGDVLPEICRDGMKIPDDEVYGIRPVGKSKCLFRVKSDAFFSSLMSEYEDKVVRYKGGEVKISNESKITTYVKIRSVPFEMPSYVLENVFSHYGKVKYIRENKIGFGYYSFALSGDRTIFMELQKHIPSYISIRGMIFNVLYSGQSRTCKKCGNTGHLIAECSADVSILETLKSTEFPELQKKKDHVPEDVTMESAEKEIAEENCNQKENSEGKSNSDLVDESGKQQQVVSVDVHKTDDLIDLSSDNMTEQADKVMTEVVESNVESSEKRKQQGNDDANFFDDTPVCNENNTEKKEGDETPILVTEKSSPDYSDVDIAQAALPFTLSTPNMQLSNLCGDVNNPSMSVEKYPSGVVGSQSLWSPSPIQQDYEQDACNTSDMCGNDKAQIEMNVHDTSMQDDASDTENTGSWIDIMKKGKAVNTSQNKKGSCSKANKEMMTKSTKRKASPDANSRIKKV